MGWAETANRINKKNSLTSNFLFLQGRARLTAANTLLARLTKSPHEGTRPGFPFPPLDAATQDCLRSHVCGRGPRRQASPRHLGISACPVQLLGPGVYGSFADPPPRCGAGAVSFIQMHLAETKSSEAQERNGGHRNGPPGLQSWKQRAGKTVKRDFGMTTGGR